MFDGRIVVTSPLPPGSLVFERMTTLEEVGRPFAFDLEVLSDRADLGAAALLGQSATVTVPLPAAGPRHWNGVVTRFEHAGRSGEQARYRLHLEPRLGTLAYRSDCRIFQNVTAAEVIETLLREHAVPYRVALSASYRRREYLVQYRESDLQLCSRLMEEEGIYYYFSHGEGEHTLVLADPPGSLDPLPGYGVVPFFPPDPTHPREVEHLDVWGHSWQVQSGAYATTDFNFETPSTDLGARLKLKVVDHPQADHERFDYPGPHTTQGEGQDLARVRLEELQARVEQARGEGTAAGLSAGSVVSVVDGLGLGMPGGKFFLTSVRHTLAVNADARSGGSVQVTCRCAVQAVDAKVAFRSPSVTPRPRVQGPQTAIVVGQAGAEIWTDRLGRVKVQFPWDRVGARNEQSSCWVRVGHPWAGPGFGFQHIPRVGHEAIVEFLEGDPDRPIITGSVYNAENLPPYPLPASATQSGVKSRSSKGGGPGNCNEIRFEDRMGGEELFVQAEKTHTVNVKGDQGVTVAGSRTLTVSGSETVTVSGSRTETITGAETETFSAAQTVTVGAAQTVTVTGPHADSFLGGSSVSVTGASSFSASGPQTGTFQAGRTDTVTGADSVTVNGDRSATIHGADDVHADTSWKATKGGSHVEVNDDVTVHGGGMVTVERGGVSVQLAADHLSLCAPGQITISCGAAVLQLSSDGTVKINGQEIHVESKGTTKVVGGKVKIN
jgi:type VI secretion system secreted protein VgrG